MLKYALLAAPASALFATSFILPTRADAMTFNTPVGMSSAAATNDVAQREQVRWLKERLVRCNLRIPCPPRGRSQFYASYREQWFNEQLVVSCNLRIPCP
jgi:hypothetical protein